MSGEHGLSCNGDDLPPIDPGYCNCGCGNRLPDGSRPNAKFISSHSRRKYHYESFRSVVSAKYTSGHSILDLMTELGVSKTQIVNALKSSGVDIRKRGQKKRVHSDGLRTIVCDLYKSGFSAPEISLKTGVSRTQVFRILRLNEISTRPEGKPRFPCWDEAFMSVTTEEQAYWIGMLVTDGCISGNRIILGLAERDAGHLRKFLVFMRSTGKIIKFRPSSRTMKDGRVIRSGPHCKASVRSNTAVECLANYGVVHNKTYTARPWNGPDFLMRHYWRGVVDGDGSVSDGSKRQDGSFAMSLAGTIHMCEGLRDFIFNKTGVIASITPAGNICHLQISGKTRTPPVIRLLYDGCSVALDRKLESAHRIIEACKSF